MAEKRRRRNRGRVASDATVRDDLTLTRPGPSADVLRVPVGAGGVATAGRLKLALWIGAAIWAFLVVVGFFAPGGWTWGMAGPIGHMENYMISLWAVSLVLAPLLASRDPLRRTIAIQIYLLGVLAIVVSTFRGEALKWISDAPPLVAAAITIGLVVWLHPDRSALWSS